MENKEVQQCLRILLPQSLRTDTNKIVKEFQRAYPEIVEKIDVTPPQIMANLWLMMEDGEVRFCPDGKYKDVYLAGKGYREMDSEEEKDRRYKEENKIALEANGEAKEANKISKTALSWSRVAVFGALLLPIIYMWIEKKFFQI